jgi:hypothetical protein
LLRFLERRRDGGRDSVICVVGGAQHSLRECGEAAQRDHGPAAHCTGKRGVREALQRKASQHCLRRDVRLT